MSSKIALQQINAAALKFLESISLQKTFETVTHQAIELLGGLDGFVLVAGSKGELEKSYASSPFDLNGILKESDIYRAFNEKISIFLEFSNQCCFMVIPLFYQNKSFGILLVRSSESYKIAENELELLKVFGSLATLAIRKAQLYEEKQKSLKIRDIFISMAAHELRTPLTTISGYAQLLDSRLKNKESPETRWVKNMLIETKRMSELINDMLQTQSIKSGKVQFKWQECHVLEILQQTIVAYHFSQPTRNIVINNMLKSVKDSVVGDCDKLQQVFDNILDNSAKFSPKNSSILIDVYAEDPFINIEIIDQGSGISKKDLPHVFNEFYKSEKSETGDGMGLGLYLVKMIITQHHGKINISSSKKGTKVTIRLRKAEL